MFRDNESWLSRARAFFAITRVGYRGRGQFQLVFGDETIRRRLRLNMLRVWICRQPRRPNVCSPCDGWPRLFPSVAKPSTSVRLHIRQCPSSHVARHHRILIYICMRIIFSGKFHRQQKNNFAGKNKKMWCKVTINREAILTQKNFSFIAFICVHKWTDFVCKNIESIIRNI